VPDGEHCAARLIDELLDVAPEASDGRFVARCVQVALSVLNLFVGASRRASQAPVSVPKNDSKPASQATPVIHSGSSDEDLALLAALAD
jgi:hypothetical protein